MLLYKSMKENETIVEGEETIKRVYEASYILVPTMSEDSATAKAEAYKKSIADLGASFIFEETPYMRDLAYEMVKVIKNANNRFDTGYFAWIKFEADSVALDALDKILKLDEDVIRYLVVKADRDVNIFTKKTLQAKIREDDEANIDTANQDIQDKEPKEDRVEDQTEDQEVNTENSEDKKEETK